jgi:hypothetical protein
LVDETFMSHSVPNMNKFEYKADLSFLKRDIARTAHKETQT